MILSIQSKHSDNSSEISWKKKDVGQKARFYHPKLILMGYKFTYTKKYKQTNKQSKLVWKYKEL